MIIVDATTVVAALVDAGPEGSWARGLLTDNDLGCPALLHSEVSNTLRRTELQGQLSPDVAALAFADLLALDVEEFGFAPFAARIWSLRQTVTAYDAWYVAIAEEFDVPLATLDERLVRAPGVECAFLQPG